VREFQSFVGITRRALSIFYASPLVCEMFASSSGSGGAISASLEVAQTNRRAGPETIFMDGPFLSWSTRAYIDAFVVYYATADGGPFTMLTANVVDLHFNVVAALPPGTYFFKVSGLEPDFGETFPSPTIGPITF
jgi:hypothetical protein